MDCGAQGAAGGGDLKPKVSLVDEEGHVWLDRGKIFLVMGFTAVITFLYNIMQPGVVGNGFAAGDCAADDG